MVISATFEQQYGDVLKEFVEYCNTKSEIMKAEFLDELLQEFIHMKMERYR